MARFPPSASQFAAQCIGNTSRSGISQFMTENTDFLISPA